MCQSFDMDLSKLYHGLVKIVVCHFSPLPNKTKYESSIGLKNSIKLKDSMPRVRCAFGGHKCATKILQRNVLHLLLYVDLVLSL